jgi:hypothetical protein
MIPAQEKGKQTLNPSTQPILRCSQRENKQTQLFPGLIPTPTKTKPRHKAATTPKALKLAIKEAGLTDKLTQTVLAETPLDEQTVAKIRSFVNMTITSDIPPPTQALQTTAIMPLTVTTPSLSTMPAASNAPLLRQGLLPLPAEPTWPSATRATHTPHTARPGLPAI